MITHTYFRHPRLSCVSTALRKPLIVSREGLLGHYIQPLTSFSLRYSSFLLLVVRWFVGSQSLIRCAAYKYTIHPHSLHSIAFDPCIPFDSASNELVSAGLIDQQGAVAINRDNSRRGRSPL